ncbi:MAG TPA: EamA family transporter [Pseudolabrys sp.]|nr:EamA family transporter [Pseudolabrys sp.]
MQTFVFIAVLFAALCHAGWNALIKTGLDPLRATTLIALGAVTVALVLLPFAGLPSTAAWPWLVASMAIHVFYFAGLIEAYRAGDLGQVYPIARGAAPLMTATAATIFVGEHLSVFGWAGIAALATGVLLLSARGGSGLAHLDRRAVGFALFTAVTICAYSVVDGVGARASGNAPGYTLSLFVGNGICLILYALGREGTAALKPLPHLWRRALLGGAMQIMSYGIALWAMTLAPIAIVATLRETSVLFGTAIAVAMLKEPLKPVRIAAAVLIMAGLVAIRMA